MAPQFEQHHQHVHTGVVQTRQRRGPLQGQVIFVFGI